MNPWFVRQVYQPLSQWLQREPVGAVLPELEASQWLPPQELERRAWVRLRELLPRIARTVPYLRRTWAHVDVARVVDRDSLQRLPILTKAEVRDHADAMQPRQFDGGRVPTRTSGSTGIPLHLVQSHAFRARHEASQWRARRWYGVDVGDPTMVMWALPVCGRLERWLLLRKYALNNILPLSLYALDPESVQDGWTRMRAWEPSFVYAYPSALAAFVREARRQGLPRPRRGPRVVMTSCEMLLEADRRDIASGFDAPVANVYGSAEFGSYVHECPLGSLHISAENVLVEVLRDGRPVIGESGEIVVTALYNEAMPLVRYAVGDVGRLLDEPCPCGRGLPRLAVELGRTVDLVRTSSGQVFSASIFDYVDKRLIAEGHRIDAFRVVQVAPDAFEVRVVGRSFDREAVEALFRSALWQEVGEVEVRLEVVEALPRDPSGKFRYFESRVGDELRR